MRPVWRHLALLAAIVIAFTVYGSVKMYHLHAPDLGWGAVFRIGLLNALTPGSFIAATAGLVGAIAVGASAWGLRGFRTAIVVLAVTTLAMIALDTTIGPAAQRELNHEAVHARNWPTFIHDPAIVKPRTDTLGYLRTGLQLLRDQPAAMHEPLGASWSQDNPRALAVDAVYNSATLLLPFVLVGVTLGITTWIRNRVSFRSARDEVVARWFIALVCAPFVWGIVTGWSQRTTYAALHDMRFFLPLEPYVPFVILALLGWRAARNDARALA